MLYKIKKLLILSLLIVPSYSFALEATYYADSFEGRGTSDGTTFSQEVFSAAACSIELGQYGYVRYGNTGAVVTVNDRPNCSRYLDVIDLSRRAFEVFAPTTVGRITEVSLSLLGKNVNSFPKKNFQYNTFANLGIRLTNGISNTYFTDDSILIRGKVTIKKDIAIVSLIRRETGERVVTQLVKTDKNKEFFYLLHLPKIAWEYYFIIAGGDSFNVDSLTIPLLKLVDKEDIIYPDIPSSKYSFRPVVSGWENPSITLPENIWASMQIVRDGRTFTTQGNALSFDDISFTPGKAQVHLDGYTLSTPSSLDRSQYIPNFYSGTIILDRIHDSTGRDKVSLRIVRKIATFSFRLSKDDSVNSSYFVTLPNGDVRKYDVANKFINENGLLKTGILISGTFPVPDEWAYKFELVQSNGFAYANFPLYQGNKVWSVLPTMTNKEKTTIRTNSGVVRKDTLTAINKLRASLGRNLVTTDDNLSLLAQAKADDMVITSVTHKNSKWSDIWSLMKYLGISVGGSIYENVAGGNVSDISLQDGLEESGSHRSAMIAPEVTKVGIGYAVKDGMIYMAQVFSN